MFCRKFIFKEVCWTFFVSWATQKSEICPAGRVTLWNQTPSPAINMETTMLWPSPIWAFWLFWTLRVRNGCVQMWAYIHVEGASRSPDKFTFWKKPMGLWSPVLVGHTQNRREVVYSSRRAQSVMAQHEPSKQPGKCIQFLRDCRCLTVSCVTPADFVVCWFRNFVWLR